MIFDGIIDWFRDLKSGMEIARSSRLYRERQDYNLQLIQRAQERAHTWNSVDLSSPYQEYYSPVIGNQVGNTYQSARSEYTNGDTGFEIQRMVESCRKTIGLWTRWDLFYIQIKHEDQTSYDNFIYLSTDGLSKHDWRVEIEGVDMV